MLDEVDEIADIIDVISKEKTGTKGDDDDKECFDVVAWMQITESYGEDDGCAEVIAPDVLLVPWT